MNDNHEPVFKRSRWGTSRYVYNPNNPVGLALIIISLAFAVIMMIMMENRAGPFAPPEREEWNSPTSVEYDWSPPTPTYSSEP
ncbi:hypothetical protein [Streptomyces sp. NPDC003023]|uniref:hypothetical protein n=1 Tax=Streptomyces sp. NPDC003023 TaxID=3364675 RepID=UPI00368B6BE1